MKRMLLLLLGAFLLVGAACGDDGGSGDTNAGSDTSTAAESPTEDAPETPAADGELAVKAVDFAFELPATAAAGKTNVVFENGGKEPHELVMVPLAEGAPPIEELIELPEKKAEEYFAGKPVSSHGPIKPGETKEISADLQAGTYGLVCFVESKEEKAPHAFLGMINN